MTPPISQTSHVLNPLATSAQLEISASQLDGLPKHLEDSVRFEAAQLVQAAGILIRLPQDVIAQSLVILYRFWAGPEGGSLLEYDAKDVAAAAVYLIAKPSATPVTPRQLLTTFHFLTSFGPGPLAAAEHVVDTLSSRHISEGQYEIQKQTLYAIEAHILRVIGFQTHIALPHTLCINYLQTLEVFQAGDGPTVAKAAFAHLNSALLSPQLLYLTHQPSALATAAIYLAAREVGVKLPEVEWWEIFDLDREELGFLVVAFRSIEGFALEERRKWSEKRPPMTVDALRAELQLPPPGDGEE